MSDRSRATGYPAAPSVGTPLNRVDGRLKVTGGAKYAAEFAVPDVAHAVIVTSTIAKGRVQRMDTAAAERAPGVLAVLTPQNAPRLPQQQAASGWRPRDARADDPAGRCGPLQRAAHRIGHRRHVRARDRRRESREDGVRRQSDPSSMSPPRHTRRPKRRTPSATVADTASGVTPSRGSPKRT